MEDLRAPDGSLHTDGCGMIRDTFAREICAMLNLPLDTSGACSTSLSHNTAGSLFFVCADVQFEVFQIHRGGFKGLLIRYPDEDFEFLCNDQNKLLDKRSVGSNIVLAFRESMLKYEGGPTMLEVNDHSSRPSHARLNETFILLLLTNGLSLEVGCTRHAALVPGPYFTQRRVFAGCSWINLPSSELLLMIETKRSKRSAANLMPPLLRFIKIVRAPTSTYLRN